MSTRASGDAPRPVIALSVGDPAGIGPEVAIRLVAEFVAEGLLPARVLLLASRRVLDREATRFPGLEGIASFESAGAFSASDASVGLDQVSDRIGDVAFPSSLPAYGAVDRAAGWVLAGSSCSERCSDIVRRRSQTRRTNRMSLRNIASSHHYLPRVFRHHSTDRMRPLLSGTWGS